MEWDNRYNPSTYNVPSNWGEIVCTCKERTESTEVERFKHYRVCSKCLLLKRFYASRCSNCNAFYMMIFVHPAWCPLSNLCWDCCQGRTDCGIDRHTHSNESNLKMLEPRPPMAFPGLPQTQEELKSDLENMFNEDMLDAIAYTYSNLFD